MKLHPPRSTRTDTLFPYTTLFRAKPWYVTTATLARRQPVGTLGAGMILFMVLTAAFADVLSPYNPVDARFSWMLQAPDAEHWLGTDQFGRDLLTRIIYGARTAQIGRAHV